jgi:hypothetical protein
VLFALVASFVTNASAENLLAPAGSTSFIEALRDDSTHSGVVVQRPMMVQAPPAATTPNPPPIVTPEAVTTPEPMLGDANVYPGPIYGSADMQPHWADNQGCVAAYPWYRIYQGSNFGLPCYQQDRQQSGFLLDGVVRAYFRNDQRIQWSGNELTFGAEGVLSPRLVQHVNDWTISANGVFFLNQPFDSNILADPSRTQYAANFKISPFYVWNMNIAVEYEDWRFVFGKNPTPFGRYYAPLQTNDRVDAPFIRTEAIGWNETGAFVHYEPGWFVADLGIINGSDDLDTNSDKGGVTRLGLKGENFAFGASAKIHDGIGSEFQKRFDNQYGFDAMVTQGNWDLSAEASYDEYGYKKPEINQVPITWQRSYYYRDIYNGKTNGRLNGIGYYVNLGYTQPRYRLDLNYGEYYPRAVGNPLHDTMNQRLMAKGTFLIMPRLEGLVSLIFENRRPAEAWRGYDPWGVFTSVQTYF